jgi:phospholipid-binding lipoprotein MlaA
VLPLLGPSTVRDTAALPVDFYVGDLVDQVDDMGVRNSLYGLRIINTRANLLGTTSVIDTAALDRYSFTRDAYLQLRSGAKAGAGADEGKLPEDY